MTRRWPCAALLLALGCPADDDGPSGDTEGTAGTAAGDDGTPTTSTPADSTAGDDGVMTGDAGSMDDGGSASDTAAADDGNDDGPIIPAGPTPCGGTVYACGDTEDNDGDGFYDLWDPECTGPCDNDESSFQTGIPGDNMDCNQDCFFDGNSGQGDDGCSWDLTCDPANPGANINCEYSGGMNCDNSPPEQTAECVAFCSQFVPPGCDCFGCCTVTAADGTTVDIFLNSDPECSLQNLDGCTTCTMNESCFNDCNPDDCELCFGETELPRGCDGQTCVGSEPCIANEDCADNFVCQQGCCYPAPDPMGG